MGALGAVEDLLGIGLTAELAVDVLDRLVHDESLLFVELEGVDASEGLLGGCQVAVGVELYCLVEELAGGGVVVLGVCERGGDGRREQDGTTKQRGGEQASIDQNGAP